MRPPIVTFICLFVLDDLRFSAGQFEDLKSCTLDRTFQKGVAKAFASKFINMLEPVVGLVTGSRLEAVEQDILELFTLKFPNQPSFIDKMTRKSRSSHDPWQDQDDEFIQEEISQMKEAQLYSQLGFGAIESKIRGLVGETQSVAKIFGGLVSAVDPDAYVSNQFAVNVSLSNDTSGLLDNFTTGESLEEINRIHQCLLTFTETDFEDSLTWLRCFYVCEDLRSISQGIGDTMASVESCSRVQWMGDLIIRVFSDLMQLDTCFIKIISPTPADQPLLLVEGDQTAKYVSFQTYTSPGMHCFPANIAFAKFKLAANVLASVFAIKVACPVEIQLSTSNYMQDLMPYVDEDLPINHSNTRPRCHNGSSINQVSIGWHKNAVNSSGLILLTNSNWNQTFVVPLAATVDLKMERPTVQSTNLSIKFVANGKRLNTTIIKLETMDQDSKSMVVCQAVNMQHITTFDNLYYNTLYEGYFTLYKHRNLPYEVQVAYQQCSVTPGVCLCGAAVKTGDDVYLADRCRRKNSTVCPAGASCDQMKATLYVNQGLTNGTTIVRLDGGMGHQVVLPHGTVVKIKSSGDTMVDIWVMPSPYDRNQTVGLCGTFNDDEKDDLLHSDLNTTTPTNEIRNNPRNFPPKNFLDSWRVPETDRIFSGAPPSQDRFCPQKYCHCSCLLLKGQRCQCGYNMLVETCDLEPGDAYTSESIGMIWKRSLYGTNQTDNRDIDVNYQPSKDRIEIGRNRTVVEYCALGILKSAPRLMTICAALTFFDSASLQDSLEQSPITRAIYACVDNIAIAPGKANTWERSYVDSAQQTCMFFVEKSPRVRRLMVKSFENETCPGQCSSRGTCADDVCVCDRYRTGYDCSIPSPAPAPVVTTVDKVYCDQRYENCSNIPFDGYNLLAGSNLRCDLKRIKVKSTDEVADGESRPTSVSLINMNQAVCLPPPGNFSYSVRIPVDDADYYFDFYVYDSGCFVCDPQQTMCQLKATNDYCIVDNQCYVDNQPMATDFCYICNVTASATSLSESTDAYCQQRFADERDAAQLRRKNMTIRISISVSLSIVVVVATLVLFLLDLRKSKKSKAILDDSYPEDMKPKNEGLEDAIELETTQSDDLNFNHLDKIPVVRSPEEDVSTVQSSSTSSSAGGAATDKMEELPVVIEELCTPTADVQMTDSFLNPTDKRVDLLMVEESSGLRSRSASSNSDHKRPSHKQHTQNHRTRYDSTSSVSSYGMGGGGPILFGVRDRVNRAYVHSDEEGDLSEAYGMGGHGWVTSGPHHDHSHPPKSG